MRQIRHTTAPRVVRFNWNSRLLPDHGTPFTGYIDDKRDIVHRHAFQTPPGRWGPSYSLRLRPNRSGETRLMLLPSREPFKRYIALSCRMAMHTSMYVHEAKLHEGAGDSVHMPVFIDRRCYTERLRRLPPVSSCSERRRLILPTFSPFLRRRAPNLCV